MSRPRMLALVAASALAVAGCGGSFTSGGPDDKSRPVTSGPSPVAGCTTDPPPRAASPKTYDAPPPMTIDTTKRYTATMETSCGRIVIRLDAAAAPKTVNNFVFLAREGFYDGLTFHRVVRDFVIQGGDPTGQGSGDAGYEFDDELPADDYTVGSVAMANAGPNTNGSQFFIVTGIDGEQLPHDYSRFGKVVLGMDAAKRIEALAPQTDDPTDPNSQTPRQKVYIFSVTISQS